MDILKIRFGNQWDTIDKITDTIIVLFENDFTSKDEAHQIAMASRELMENASKYSVRKPSTIIISMDKKRSFVRINVRNITTLNYINNFVETIDDIKTGDPDEAYQKAALKTIDEAGVSRLGIARIRYELKTIISYRIIKNVKAGSEPDPSNPDYPENSIRKLSVYLQIPITTKTLPQIL